MAATAPAMGANDYTLVWPTQEVMLRFRPDYQVAMHATLNCVATPQNTLGDCKVVATVPTKPDSMAARIGDRALKVASTMRITRPAGYQPGPTPEPITVGIGWPAH
ncbi:MAG TPA: hypothetical protein VG407_09590 [Caulobacteraceae bacterium]|jgi:hypothetical protein|nr:hypothetical protein [Caulobacteraceae bacterium]